MATRLSQVAFTSGEVSPSLAARVDLAKFQSALKVCRNFYVKPQGGVSNRAGTQFIYDLGTTSTATLLPFIRSETDAYMIVLQEETAKVFRDGSYVNNTGSPYTIIGVVQYFVGPPAKYDIELSAAHGLTDGDPITIAGVVSTGTYDINGNRTAFVRSATKISITIPTGQTWSYVSGGTVAKAFVMATPYQDDELASIRFTQSADVMTLVHQGYFPAEITRTGVTSFTYAAIDDIETGPFLDINDTATTLTASAATGTGITLTASTSIFNANHVGALAKLQIEDLSDIPPWEPGTAVTALDQRLSNGKVYSAVNSATTGTVPPYHDEGIQYDGASAVQWEFLHPLYGVARITAQAGTTATADVLDYMPVVTPKTTTKWALGAWSEDQGYPGCVTYYGDRLVFASTLERPQDQYASKTGDYHDFSESSPIVEDDSITQTLNSRQTNAIVELVPLEQLISLTANATWASPNRGESWSPQTVGFFPQSSVGAAALRAPAIGDGAIYAERFGTRLRELKYAYDRDKYGGAELTVLARHLFEEGTIVDMDYAEYPDGILWIIRSDGVLIGLTYLPEQEVVAFHRHDTSGFFERVCVIPEDGRDAVYFVVRRTLGDGTEVRYLERLANRTNDAIEAFFIDCGLTYDGRNTTSTTITVTGASYGGGDTVTLTATDPIFASTDIDDAIQFGNVHCIITGYTSTTIVTAELQSPLGAALQGVATTEWTFARNTFSGADHLEGLVATGLADGNVIDPDDTTTNGIVTGGSLVLNYPAGVVNLGIGYTSEIQTLTLNIAGGAQIRPNAKIVPKVSIVVEETTGLKVGHDSDNLTEVDSRSFEFYTDPATLQTGVQTAYLLNTYDKNSSIIIQQSYPKPANILAVLPTVIVGGDG